MKKLFGRRRRGGRLSRQVSLGLLEDAMARAETTEPATAEQPAPADPVPEPEPEQAPGPGPEAAPEPVQAPRLLLYAANGSAHHYARPGRRRPLCAAGAREGAVWHDDQFEARRLPLCRHCERIDGSNPQTGPVTGGTTP